MSAPYVELRPALPQDAAGVGEIWRQGWSDGHLGSVPAELAAARQAESFEARAARRLDDTTVAVVQGHVAGFVMVVGDEVEQIYVAGDHRGSGVADLLLDHAERRIKGAGYNSAWLAVVPGNSGARRFYQRCGWTDAGLFDYQAATERGPVAVPCHRYVKRL